MTDPHEEPPRSKGGDPCNPLDVIGLSRFCHDLRHFGSRDKRLRISYLDGTADRRVEFAIGSARWVTRSNETTGPVIIDGEHYEQPMTAAGITRVQYLQEQGLNAD